MIRRAEASRFQGSTQRAEGGDEGDERQHEHDPDVD